jgi:hypothetical protein
MAYVAEISRSNPSALIFLLDQSGSMSDDFGASFGDPQIRKADFLADVVNRTLYDLVLRCAKADDVRDYYNIAVIGYGDGVSHSLAGALSGRDFVGISELAKTPLRIETRSKKVPDGAGGLVEQQVKFPVWIDSKAGGATPMCAALKTVSELLSGWINEAQHKAAFPPTILHITDGESTDGDPFEIAKELRSLSTSDGAALLFNCHISGDRAGKVEYPSSSEMLTNEHAKSLFEISSVLPESFVGVGKQIGLNLTSGARGFVFNADATSLVQFFEIGTRPSNMR